MVLDSTQEFNTSGDQHPEGISLFNPRSGLAFLAQWAQCPDLADWFSGRGRNSKTESAFEIAYWCVNAIKSKMACISGIIVVAGYPYWESKASKTHNLQSIFFRIIHENAATEMLGRGNTKEDPNRLYWTHSYLECVWSWQETAVPRETPHQKCFPRVVVCRI